jgi:hypothetical protein
MNLKSYVIAVDLLLVCISCCLCLKSVRLKEVPIGALVISHQEVSVFVGQAAHILFRLLVAINCGPRNILSGSLLPRNMKYRALFRFRLYFLLFYEMCFEATLNCISGICDDAHSLYEYHVRHPPCSEGYLICLCMTFR